MKPLLFLLLFFASTVKAEPRGYELVSIRMPEFSKALAKEVGPAAAVDYFADWEEQDVAFLKKKFEGLLKTTNPALPFVPTLEKLTVSYQTHIFGCAGEVYGNVQMRKLAEKYPGSLYMDSYDYDRLNPDGNKPDGVIYRIENGKLVILKVMESKLGSSTWSQGQIEGFLERWSRVGFTTPDGKTFRPNEIVFQTPSASLAISHVSVSTLKQNSLLVSTRTNAEFPGTLAQLPFNASHLRSAAINYLENLRGTRSAPKGSSREPAIVLEGEALEEFKVALEDFISENQRWPGTSDGPIGAFLAKNINRRGGQTKVLMNDLPGHWRHYMTMYGTLPAMSPFANNILQMDPSNPDAPSILRSYIRRYESRKEGAPSAIHDALIRKNPAWREFFVNHPLESLRVADLNEVNRCLDVLLEAEKARRAAASQAAPE